MSPALPRTPLCTARLLLRPYEPADAPALAALLLAERARLEPSFPERVQAVQAPGGAAGVVQAFGADWQSGRFYVLGIWQRATDAYLGDICLMPQLHNQAEIGYYLAQAAEGQGYAREALAAMVEFGFVVAGATRLLIRCYCNNLRGQAVAQAAGFRPVPRPARHWWRSGAVDTSICAFVLER